MSLTFSIWKNWVPNILPPVSIVRIKQDKYVKVLSILSDI